MDVGETASHSFVSEGQGFTASRSNQPWGGECSEIGESVAVCYLKMHRYSQVHLLHGAWGIYIYLYMIKYARV